MNVGENIVDLINVSKNYEKPIVDFGSTAFSHATNATTDFIDFQENEIITTNLTVFKLQKEITLLQPGTREWFANGKKENFTLDSQILKMFLYISDRIISSSRPALIKYQMVSSALMRLWLNLMINDLAYHFKVISSTASSAFLKIIDVLFLHLKTVIK